MNEADIGRRVLAAIAEVNARRQAAGDALRAEILAILAKQPDVPAKRLQGLLSRNVSMRRVYEVLRELRLRSVGAAQTGSVTSNVEA